MLSLPIHPPPAPPTPSPLTQTTLCNVDSDNEISVELSTLVKLLNWITMILILTLCVLITVEQ